MKKCRLDNLYISLNLTYWGILYYSYHCKQWTATCFERDEDLKAAGVSPSKENHIFWKTGFPRMLQALFGDSAGTGLAEGGVSREGRGHQQKELAHAQYWKSAIHSLSTAPLLSLLSFTLTTARDNVRRREKLREWEKEFVQYVCRKTIGWTESGGDHCRTVWQAYKAKSHWTNISSLNWYEMNNKWLINAS